ncbi:hypothetical protein PVAP13_8NG083801 [Panicum virgatum]|uniref:Uncharacterized protein n=1 Tax=Panicum virgatum TaxID=38727 RepID=A0A8T0P802_PANVG|nr:hypothetical protein PVAP13_8NG083801 [Panicum virgatum]
MLAKAPCRSTASTFRPTELTSPSDWPHRRPNSPHCGGRPWALGRRNHRNGGREAAELTSPMPLEKSRRRRSDRPPPRQGTKERRRRREGREGKKKESPPPPEEESHGTSPCRRSCRRRHAGPSAVEGTPRRCSPPHTQSHTHKPHRIPHGHTRSPRATNTWAPLASGNRHADTRGAVTRESEEGMGEA